MSRQELNPSAPPPPRAQKFPPEPPPPPVRAVPGGWEDPLNTRIRALVEINKIHQADHEGYCPECGSRWPCKTYYLADLGIQGKKIPQEVLE